MRRLDVRVAASHREADEQSDKHENEYEDGCDDADGDGQQEGHAENAQQAAEIVTDHGPDLTELEPRGQAAVNAHAHGTHP